MERVKKRKTVHGRKPSKKVLDWLLAEGEPWVRHGVYAHLMSRSHKDRDLQVAQKATLSHPKVKELLAECRQWPGSPLKSHRDTQHLLHKLGLLADFGLTVDARGVRSITSKLRAHRDKAGAFQTMLLIPKKYHGDGKPGLNWMLCDAPLVLHCLLAFGLKDDERVTRATEHLIGQVRDNGWPCAGSVGKFRGPGRKDDPCPIATLAALKALALSPTHKKSKACRNGTEMLLSHWEHRKERRIYMFGMGRKFAKLKYPMFWYDLLHVVDVLSRFSWTHRDQRFAQMRDLLFSKADDDGRFTPESIWMAYKEFEFSQKKMPSPTLTLAVERIRKRLH